MGTPGIGSAQNHPETYTPGYLARIQSYVEALHLAINENSTENPTAPVFINYRGSDNPAYKNPHLAIISPDRLVSPEDGFEAGYVPILISLYHADDVGTDVNGNINDSAKGLWSQPSQECSNDSWIDNFSHQQYGDTDGDGISNNIDADDDNDGVLDGDDLYPLISIIGFSDTDLDGGPDECDSICLDAGMIADADNDGDGDCDGDGDGDGYSDSEEMADGNNPLDANSSPMGGLSLTLIKAFLDKQKVDQ